MVCYGKWMEFFPYVLRSDTFSSLIKKEMFSFPNTLIIWLPIDLLKVGFIAFKRIWSREKLPSVERKINCQNKSKRRWGKAEYFEEMDELEKTFFEENLSEVFRSCDFV